MQNLPLGVVEALQQEVDGFTDQLGPAGMLGISQPIQLGQLAFAHV
jgi:hypothetical protein